MGKPEEQSFVAESADAVCEPTSGPRLLRQAPRSRLSQFSSAGNIIPMSRKKSPSKIEDKGNAAILSETDKQRMTEQIGRQLRGMYDGLLNQPVPDRFMDLMKQLEGAERDAERDQ